MLNLRGDRYVRHFRQPYDGGSQSSVLMTCPIQYQISQFRYFVSSWYDGILQARKPRRREHRPSPPIYQRLVQPLYLYRSTEDGASTFAQDTLTFTPGTFGILVYCRPINPPCLLQATEGALGGGMYRGPLKTRQFKRDTKRPAAAEVCGEYCQRSAGNYP